MSMIKIIFSLLLIFLLSGCEEKESQVLNVGISPWPGYEPLSLASELGFYGDTQIRVIRFATPTESYRALRDGIIDVAAFTADEVFHFAEVREKPRIFLVLDISNGADAIVAKKELKTLDDLKGKRLGVEGSALGDFVINRALDFTDNLQISDLKLLHFEIDEQERAFLEDKVDALITYEPSKSLLLKAGAHVLFDSSQIPNEIVDVLVANDNTLESRSKELAVLAEGWFRSLHYIKENYEKALRMMAQHEETDVNEFKAGYEDLIIPSKERNIEMLGQNCTLLKPMQRLSNLMYAKGSLKKEIDVRPLLDRRIIELIKE